MQLSLNKRAFDSLEPIGKKSIDFASFSPTHRRAGMVVVTALTIYAAGSLMFRIGNPATPAAPQSPANATTLTAMMMPKLN